MSISQIVQQTNEDVLELWRQEFDGRENEARCPLLYSDLEPGGILFVGCNPALPKRNHYQVPSLASVSKGDPSVAALVEEEGKARKNYPYYRPCQEIADDLGMAWGHVDWFFQRGTSQRDLQDEVSEMPARWDAAVELSNFARSQLQLSRRLMDACQPRLVLVANAFASKIAKWQFSLGDLDSDGLLWGEIGGKLVPVFLSSMLTGQRALDRGSRGRLEWHLRQAKIITERAVI